MIGQETDAFALQQTERVPQEYLDTGNEALLTPFRGLMVAGYELETDPDVLNAMAVRGLFDSGPEGLQIYSNNT